MSALKGVILSINSHVQIVDITHEVAPQNIFEAAFNLLVNYKYFPSGTIHVAVVDPGVGSSRKIICAKTSAHIFIGPDNGMFSPILDREKKVEVYEISNPELFLPQISNTFHGRDKMAPAAANISRGFPVKKVGSKLQVWKKINLDRPQFKGNSVEGKVISVDSFGNLITNITRDDLSKLNRSNAVIVKIKNKAIPRISRYFGEVPKGHLLSILGSSDFLEIARNLGSAQKLLDASLGEKVVVAKRK